VLVPSTARWGAGGQQMGQHFSPGRSQSVSVWADAPRRRGDPLRGHALSIPRRP
jgi:hypothetical protein